MDEEGRRKIELLLGRTKRMHNLIEGVLAYSRLGRMKPTLCPVDCQEEVKQVIDLLAPPKGIRVEVRVELPEIVYDRVHFVQVVQNLIGNAVKYHHRPNGLVEISCREGAGEWEFCVADDGPGIDPQHHERIFKIFQSLQARDEVESTGIGLTIVKKIVEQYGGKIRLDSEPGRGSRFYFTVPRGLKPEEVECRKHLNGGHP
jgi:signal transduction histidine kinase